MRQQLQRLLVLVALASVLALAPATAAHADIGSTIVERFWDSAVTLIKNRLESSTPPMVNLLQEAEKVFLGHTEDVTVMGPIRDAYAAMRVAGLLLLGLCTVISLAGLTEASLLGHGSDLTEWVRRFCIAAFMTLGGIHFYGLWIRVFNVLIDGFRNYLDAHWTGPNDPTALLTLLIPMMNHQNVLLLGLFALVTVVLLLALWFLIGGVRMAEMALAVIIAPLVWPLYLLPSLEEIPKAAFRMFLGINALLLIVVAMLRLAVRMVPGGGLANTVWNFVPAISLLMMTVFLPTMIKRLVGQGNTGAGTLATAVHLLAGIQGLSWATSAGGAAAATAKPPATTATPQAPQTPSSYPVAPLSEPAPAANASPQMEWTWSRAPRQLYEGMQTARAAIGDGKGPVVIEMAQSKPGSNKFDTVGAVTAFMDGARAGGKPQQPDEE